MRVSGGEQGWGTSSEALAGELQAQLSVSFDLGDPSASADTGRRLPHELILGSEATSGNERLSGGAS